jgi:hypothetical protein
MLKYWLPVASTLFFGAQTMASQTDFCPPITALPKEDKFYVFNKEISGRTYIIAAARLKTIERLQNSSLDSSLEARRQIIGQMEGRTIGLNESFMASYRFIGLETRKVLCGGRSFILFIQDQRAIQKLEVNPSSSSELSSGHKPDPSSSAEENLMDALRNKR